MHKERLLSQLLTNLSNPILSSGLFWLLVSGMVAKKLFGDDQLLYSPDLNV